jgi:5-methylcytosine-specific restriction endonuclease McrA
LFELERAIMSGDFLEGRAVDTKASDCATVKAGDRATTGSSSSGQMSGVVFTDSGANGRGDVRRFGRVRFRWVVSETTHRFFRALERAFSRVLTRVCRKPASFLRFLCENFCRTWLPALRRERLTESAIEPEYFGVYRRDRFRCTSPVCTRRDVTPHHLVFRSHGGSDDDENVASLCVWCHLHGVHEGRIVAEPPASNIHWRIGRSGTLRVDGRTLLAS